MLHSFLERSNCFKIHNCTYFGIILIRGSQCSWIVRIFAGSWGPHLVGNCIAMQDNSIILQMVRVNVNSWESVTHEIHEY